MTDKLEVGLRVRAKYSDGEFYPAEVAAISEPPPLLCAAHGWLALLDGARDPRLTAHGHGTRAYASVRGCSRHDRDMSRLDVFAGYSHIIMDLSHCWAHPVALRRLNVSSVA